MLNIKEIALKHAREYLTFKLGGRKGLDVEEIVCDDEIYKEIVNELAQQFEALIAEIAKGNAPVAWWNGKETAFFEHETDGPVGKVKIPLYTFPPTAEQIANERYPDKTRSLQSLFTSDQLAAAILKATKPLEDSLAVVKKDRADLYMETLTLRDQLANAEQRVAEAIVDMLQQKHRNCFGAHSFYLAASVATANGEYRKFMKGE